MDLSDLTRILFIFVLTIGISNSLEDQLEGEEKTVNYAAIDSPFRSQKVNMIWNKARKSLTNQKLKALHTELKVHDKEAMALKKLLADGMDKEGLREAELRKKFNGIMHSYGMVKPSIKFEDDKKQLKKTDSLFKDKKLERLWQKAYKAGLEEDELILLKNEFLHHQEKLDELHQLKQMAHTEDINMMSNNIEIQEIRQQILDEEDTGEKIDANTLDGKAKKLKQDYERLHRLATNTSPTEFSEPKVRILWKLAQEADFDIKELESLKEEMHHYEKRLQKLQNLKTEIDLSVDQPDLNEFVTKDKMGKKLAKHTDSVQKLHAELEAKIVTRHSEF